MIHIRSNCPSNPSVFDVTTPPTISLDKYLERVFKYSKATPEVVVCAVILLRRVCRENKIDLTNFNAHRLFVICVMVFSKFYDDSFVNNRRWSCITAIDLEKLNQLEVSLLNLCQFDLRVSPSAFHECVLHLSGCASKQQAASSSDVSPFSAKLAPRSLSKSKRTYHSSANISPGDLSSHSSSSSPSSTPSSPFPSTPSSMGIPSAPSHFRSMLQFLPFRSFKNVSVVDVSSDHSACSDNSHVTPISSPPTEICDSCSSSCATSTSPKYGSPIDDVYRPRDPSTTTPNIACPNRSSRGRVMPRHSSRTSFFQLFKKTPPTNQPSHTTTI